ncbi:hypothetical protein EVA_02936 [gut metagenome]|uniref:Uncharacterized protein n=1 Tax=gut metagenome TaxID=749906 RepID=J9D824_9ZZZZ
MCTPPHNTRHRKERRINLNRQTYQVIDKARIEVHIRTELLTLALHVVHCLHSQPLNAFHKLKLLGSSLFSCQFTSHLLQQHRARVRQRVDSVTYTVNQARLIINFLLQHAVEVIRNLRIVIPMPDMLLQMLHHVVHTDIRASVFRPFNEPIPATIEEYVSVQVDEVTRTVKVELLPPPCSVWRISNKSNVRASSGV